LAPPKLSRREALLLRELSRFPGRPVTWPILADAMELDCSLKSGTLVRAAVQRIRVKFGADVIKAYQGTGFYLPKDALDR
jgi:DNA-binding response OmpR family regulator